ncbi:LOW QUALITY PROTEIN: protein ADM2a [Pimephales promelas]|uniref:LOW QUALITY PROTEIN: protein ADM2a n=1 Tax=Pimephales promelas TaxID=90988 RepID=UPI001955C73C|nr:LOW QUALITY PROTEIN: protein ADM2a [Pimephales promelas]
MGALFPVFVYCISLLSSQLLALPVRDRLDFMTRLHQLKEDPISPDVTEHPNTDHGVSIDRTILWRAILSRPPPPCPKRLPQPKAGESSQTDESPRQRERRNVHSRGHHNHHHGQLMRVGCVLGTCQVQNLSHRLYQLGGQSRREDSPINPSNPRSYG